MKKKYVKKCSFQQQRINEACFMIIDYMQNKLRKLSCWNKRNITQGKDTDSFLLMSFTRICFVTYLRKSLSRRRKKHLTHENHAPKIPFFNVLRLQIFQRLSSGLTCLPILSLWVELNNTIIFLTWRENKEIRVVIKYPVL